MRLVLHYPMLIRSSWYRDSLTMTRITQCWVSILFLARLLNTLGARVQGSLALGLVQQFFLRLGI